jgi:hypothetical protein
MLAAFSMCLSFLSPPGVEPVCRDFEETAHIDLLAGNCELKIAENTK